MDRLSVVGAIVAVGAVLLGNVMDGGKIAALLNLPAAIIVIGGSLGATLLQTPMKMLPRALGMMKYLLFPPEFSLEDLLKKILKWGDAARKQGVLGLEALSGSEKDPFIQRGLTLIADGNNPNHVRNSLELEIAVNEQQDLQAAQFLEHLAGYAPTMGIVGAVLGLIHVMSQLEDPSALGPGIATAFVATVYGVGFANLLAMPMSQKLKQVVLEEVRYREMVVEGLTAVAQGEHPNTIRFRLQAIMVH
jgi:chemotaxis protein MotA